ncbi:MAG: hypothetical protein AMXMBFR7_10650 [Planctomycetota bacterium]
MTVHALSACFGLGGCLLVALFFLTSAFRFVAVPVWARWGFAAAAVAALLVPLDGISGAEYVRSWTGDVSLTLAALLALWCWEQLSGRRVLEARSLTRLSGAVLALAVCFYPFALGWSMFDPYALGYGSHALFASLLLLTLAAWYAEEHVLVLVLTFGAAGFALDVLESRNLWDYLIDPVLSLLALVWLASRLALRWPWRAKPAAGAASEAAAL